MFLFAHLDIDPKYLMAIPAGAVLIRIAIGLTLRAMFGLIVGILRQLLGGGRRQTKTRPRGLPAPFRIHKAHVIDGDTLARGKWRIRIYGMDAPEASQSQGAAATAKLREIVGERDLLIQPRDIDVYGRLVARVLAGNVDVAAAMIDSGHAIATSDFTRAYSGHEAKARKSKAGLWRQGAIANPAAHRRAGK